MKAKYTAPSAEITLFETADIITASSVGMTQVDEVVDVDTDNIPSGTPTF